MARDLGRRLQKLEERAAERVAAGGHEGLVAVLLAQRLERAGGETMTPEERAVAEAPGFMARAHAAVEAGRGRPISPGTGKSIVAILEGRRPDVA